MQSIYTNVSTVPHSTTAVTELRKTTTGAPICHGPRHNLATSVSFINRHTLATPRFWCLNMDQFFQQRARDLASDLESHQTDAATDLLRREVTMHPGQVANIIATANAEVHQDAAMQRTYPNADHAFIKPGGEVVGSERTCWQRSFCRSNSSHVWSTVLSRNPVAPPYYAERPPVMPMVPIVPGITLMLPLGHHRGFLWSLVANYYARQFVSDIAN